MTEEPQGRAPKDFDTNMVIATLAGLEDTDIDNLYQTFLFSSGDAENVGALWCCCQRPYWRCASCDYDYGPAHPVLRRSQVPG